MYRYIELLHLKEKIKRELKKFHDADPAVFNENNIDLFLKTLLYNVTDPLVKFDGLTDRVPKAMTKVLADDIQAEDVKIYFPDFVKVESFFQKVLYLVDRPKYDTITAHKKGFAAYVSALNLNPNGISLLGETPDTVKDLPYFAEHLSRVYHMRNIESHNCINWPKKDLFENIESTLIIYLYATYKHAPGLRSLVDIETNLSTYLNKAVHDFEVWQQRFVHITGIEQFEEIEIYAVESDEWLDDAERVLREGRIDDLRKSITENSMVVLGDPGMGKSTTLQYIAYKDAQAILNPVGAVLIQIPIFLELKLFSKDDIVLNVAAKKLGTTEAQLIEYLNDGRITCLLDGLNEVLTDLRQPIRSDIENMIVDYPRSTFIITSRPLAYSNEFRSSPVFVLQKMEDLQVEEFLQKNCRRENIRRLILMEIKQNVRLGKIVRVPLLLKMLINVVIANRGVMPESKVQIIKKFIQNLYDREDKKMTTDIDLRIVHRLLCFVAYKTRELNGANVGWKMESMEAIIESRIEKSRFKINAYEFIDLAVDLNILVIDDYKYSFIHELYQEYFASEEIYRLEAVTHGSNT